MVAAKISSPPYGKDGVIGAWAPEELELNTRLLQKSKEKDKSKDVLKNNS
jgi:hypothetical protein